MNKILILDCNAFEREKLKINLSTIGKFTCTEIVSLHDFYLVKDSLTEIFSLVIMDIEFPTYKDGYKVLSALKNSSLKQVPLVIITKLNDAHHKIKVAKEFNAKDYIKKPYTNDRLSTSIESILPSDARFIYSFENSDIISTSVEDLIIQQINLCKRSKKPLSLIFITPNYTENDLDKFKSNLNVELENIYQEILKYIKLSIRNTDMVFFINKTDILILLHYSNNDGALNVLEKITLRINSQLNELRLNVDNIFHTACVTFPSDGENLEDLMSLALRKTHEKSALNELVAINRHSLNKAKMYYTINKKTQN